MRRSVFVPFITFLLLVGALSGCGKKAPQVVTVESKSTLATLRSMRSAYETKDVDAFMKRVAAGYPERQKLQQSLKSTFSKYDSIHFVIHDEKMLIMIKETKHIQATFTWDGEWKTPGRRTIKDGGRITFVFDLKGQQLRTIKGNNPFIPRRKRMKQ